VRNTDLTRLGNCLRPQVRKRDLIQINQFRLQLWGQDPSIYSQRIHEEKKTNRSKFGSEMNPESNSDPTQKCQVGSISRLVQSQ